MGSVPEWGGSPEGGNGKQLQYSCLENPMDRGGYSPQGHKESDRTAVTQRVCMRAHTHAYSVQSFQLYLSNKNMEKYIYSIFLEGYTCFITEKYC